MMKILNGSELAGFMKERQAKQVRGLVQADNVQPKLAIVQVKDDPVIDVYIKLKQAYGDDIGIAVDVHKITQESARETITELNADTSVHGIIVQLPLSDTSQQTEILNSVSLAKDVDGLADGSLYDPATPQAILWLLAGYNVELRGKDIVIVGRGPLVGSPLEKMMLASQLQVRSVDKAVTDLKNELVEADIIITATGQAGLITSEMIKEGAVVIDAGSAVENGAIKGDLDDEVLQRDDLKITPAKGGVGPLTVVALFDNVIKAARATITEDL